jgi:hypothetical protein
MASIKVSACRSATGASKSRSFMRVNASTAENGSSSSSTRGWVNNPRAIATRCAWPPDSCLGSVSA